VELNQCIQLTAPTTCTVLNTWILKAYLRHVSAQVYHLQGEQNARFKTNCQWKAIIYKVLLQSVVAPSLVPFGYWF
jgi:hypothetical protein